MLELDIVTAGLLARLTPLLAASYRRRFTAEADAVVAAAHESRRAAGSTESRAVASSLSE